MIEAVTTSPLFGIVLCIGTFQIGRWVQKKTGLTLANPLVIAILLCIGVLLIFDIPYEDFAIGGDIVNMMLGPATAVLALNIYNQYAVLKRHFVPVLVGCTAGSLFSLASVNEEAMVMELSFGEFQMLCTGDIGADTEKKLLASGILKDVDCLKVGHHGSRYSTTEAFLEKIKPELAIISCSSINTYGHPSPETVERLEAAGSQVEYTMKNGAITVETDGKKLKIYRFRRD